MSDAHYNLGFLTMDSVDQQTSGQDFCVSCKQRFDANKKRRRLIDCCGHERCFTCMFAVEECPLCVRTRPSSVVTEAQVHADGSSNRQLNNNKSKTTGELALSINLSNI